MGEVEAFTDGEFKASVVGAYERGERAISVQRLTRLAEVYGVGPTELFPGSKPAEGPVIDIDAVAAGRDHDWSTAISRPSSSCGARALPGRSVIRTRLSSPLSSRLRSTPSPSPTEIEVIAQFPWLDRITVAPQQGVVFRVS